MRQADDRATALATADRRLEAFLGELARSLKATAFYPRSHPALRGATERAHRVFRRLFEESSAELPLDLLELSVSRRGFALGERPIGGGVTGVPELARECVVRRVSRLFFRPEATADDLARLLGLLTVDPDVFAAGGFEERLAAEGVRAIWANEANLDLILERLAEAPPPQAGGDEEEPEPPEPEAQSAEAALLALLARLERETDTAAYQETIELLRPRAVELRNAGDFGTLLPALVVLGQHAAPGGRRPAAAQQLADALLAELVDGPTLDWIIDRVGSREARGERELLGGVLLRLGARALPPLLDALSVTEDRQARRAFSQIVGLFGETAVPELELRLRDERWFVVRNMATLLGDIRNPRSVPALVELLAHEEGRVRRAALQALARIGGPAATAHVVRCLTSGDPELQVQAILALGARREATALPALEAIARGSAPAGARRPLRDLEVRRYAIEALGRIGGPSALRVLADLLGGGGFWRRLLGRGEVDLIRIAAAEALASLGGPEARRLLKAAAAGRRGAVADRCRELAATLG